MRRSDREVTGFENLLEIVNACGVCRLAIANGDYPYILPLNFGAEAVDGTLYLYFHGAGTGTKYELLQNHPQVSFEMDCEHKLVLEDDIMNCTMEYRSVIGRGRMEIVPDGEKLHGLEVLMAQYHAEGFAFSHAAIPRTTVMRLTVEEMTGKCRKVKSKA